MKVMTSSISRACGALFVAGMVFGAPLAKAEPTVEALQTVRQSATAIDQTTRLAMLEPLTRRSGVSDLAHWHLGKVRRGDEWISIREYAEGRASDPLLQEYLSRRAEVERGRESEFRLAGWCRTQGLHDAERVHLHHVVRNPREATEDRSKAMQRLGLKVYQGRLRTQKQVAFIEQRLEDERRQEAKWRPIIQGWLEGINAGTGRKQRYALSELRQLKDPGAIRTLEKMMAFRGEAFAKEFVSILNTMVDVRSTEALVRQSVDSPWDSVRSSARTALKERPLHDYTPRLLDELNSPVESRFRVGIDPDGMVRRSHQFYREDQNEKHLTTITNARGPERINRAVAVEQLSGGVAFAPRPGVGSTTPRRRARGADYTEQELAQWAAHFERQKRIAFARQVIAQQEAVRALQVQAELSVRNEQVRQRNERVFAALKETTGETTTPSSTVAWWDWWDEYNDRYREQKPIRTHVASRSDPLQVSYVPVDCFPEGTIVHTEVGTRPIETIRAGDRVLSQNIDTGELAYKIVVRRTVRPPGEILNVRFVDGEVVQTTKGHPFWVNNVGWRMAKRLAAKQSVYSVLGEGEVSSVESHDEPLPAINLVVDDFGTFFVGERGRLVHGTPHRQPTTALVPGVRAEQLTSDSQAN